MKHNHLLNEIKGTYTKADFWFDLIVTGAFIVAGLAVALIVFELLGGADALISYVEMV